MGAAEDLPRNAHIIEVDRVGPGFSVTHAFRHRVLFTATYRNQMDAIRTANKLATQVQNEGEEAILYIRGDLRRESY